MTTKIDAAINTSGTNAGRPVGGNAPIKSATAVSGDSGSKSVAAVAATDSVQLSGDAVRLQQFEKTLSAIPSTDRSRVERIRQSIADGSYTVDPKAIAGKLVRLEFELGQT